MRSAVSRAERWVAVVLLSVLAPAAARAAAHDSLVGVPLEQQWGFIETWCGKCHNATDWAGGVAFDVLQPQAVGSDAKVWEKAVRKLRGRLMPPPGEPQPDAAALGAFAGALEARLDAAVAAAPDPGSVPLHRLNKPEYANAIRDLLGLEIDVHGLLPRDDQSAGFDNSAAVLKVSPAFLDQYLSAARQVSIQAVGNPGARLTSRVYAGTAQALQYMHVEGLPLGTRGGLVIEHAFPVDGDYEITVNGLVGGGYLWGVMDPMTLVVTLDGRRVFQAELGDADDLDAVDLKQAAGVGAINDRFRNIRFRAPAGTHRIGVTFRQKTAAVSNELLHGFVPVEGMAQLVNGNSGGPRITNVEVKGPVNRSALSQTISRRKVFSCYPTAVAEEPACARQILARLARQAFRRPVSDSELQGIVAFYDEGRRQADFDTGIQKGLLAILASPRFLYRAHVPPAGTQPGQVFALRDIDLASRLSFFLWSGPPDDTLVTLAEQGRLRDPQVRAAQVKRMLADPRAHNLVTNFAFQWLNVQGLDLVNPDPNLFPDYTEDLVPAMRKELELFIGSVFETDNSVLDLLTARHSYLNERLALHYGLRDVRGGQFRRVEMPQSWRSGLLGKGAFLMATSYANRTTPVLRGAYVLEKFLGTPPAAPPPSVEAFPESQEGGEQLTVRERLEQHRQLRSCNACHGVIDPLGLALENFNAVGQWRDKDIDAQAAIDASGKLVDGTPLQGPDDLRNALVERAPMFISTFTENLMTFALGRPLQHSDMPTLRAIVRETRSSQWRLSALVSAIVESPAFLQDRLPADTPVPIRTAQTIAQP